jgi:hypothetical protein
MPRRAIELTGLERILLRGLAAREELLEPILTQFNADRDAVLTDIAHRLNIAPADFGVRYVIDPKNATLHDLGEPEYAHAADAADDHP